MKKRILVIDDEKEDLALIKRILQKNNYSVCTASSGKSSIILLNKKKFDLILIDVLMPNLSGYEVLRLLKRKVNNQTKLVYISIVPKIEVMLDDADGFIQKPFSNNSLLEGVKNALKNKKEGIKK